MVKINFNTPISYLQRDNLIRSMRALGFQYERIFQSGTYVRHRFYGRLPTSVEPRGIEIFFDSKDVADNFLDFKDDYFELYFLTERKCDYENKL